MEETRSITLLILLLPLAAFLYASVGHGGASSYLVILALFGFAPAVIRPTALILNIGVSALSFLSFRKTTYFQKDLFVTLILFSIPASFLGSQYLLRIEIYQKILGILLIFPILGLFNVIKFNQFNSIERKFWMAPLLGLLIGLVSGLIGIGGGILLSPILLMLGWSNMKQTASISALFIFFNSISGIFGANLIGFTLPKDFLWMLLPTLAGGIFGGLVGAGKLNNHEMKIALATVLAIASVKFIFQ